MGIPAKALDLLSRAKTIAVVGLSDDPARASHGVSKYMMRQGYHIIPVNPQVQEVFGLPSYSTLADIPAFTTVDIVNIFRRPEFVPEIVAQAITRHVPCVWMQLGVVHEEAAERGREAGILVVMDACIMVAHMGSRHQKD